MAGPEDSEDDSATMVTPAFASHQAMSILDLSMDVLVHILSLLQPADVVSASQRWLWITLLRKVCDQQTVFKPTFDKMESMSLQELKQAAITPTRLLDHLKQCSLSGNTPRTSMRTLTHEPPNFFIDGENTFMLAPGARYLVTCTQTTLSLWDLGHGAKSTFKCCCSTKIASAESAAFGVFACQITDLRVASERHQIPWVSGKSIYCVYEVFPMNATPNFCTIASASIERFADISRCSANEIVLAGINGDLASTSFIVWNYVVDAWVKWNMEDLAIDLEVITNAQLHVCNGCVIVLKDDTITVYTISGLIPRVDGERPPTIVNKPQASYKLAFKSGCYASAIVTNPWYEAATTGNISNYLDILCKGSDGGQTALQHCIMRRAGNPADPGSLEVIPTDEILGGNGFFDLNCVPSTWATPRDLICVSMGDFGVLANIFTLPSPKPGHESALPFPEFAIWPLEELTQDVSQINFCVFSGRICMQTETLNPLGEHSCAIRILDVILP
ncbi:hypothetical protein FIBSPDRAFT_894671 [Athelia psychrophila]|uniref:F-box domain-containing protein n=1 Tax=Athelia psychrophila TaxID=1759441 RepID=A0A166FKR0_9AGAM|nr:hypothetical protein FIBSPDRAFT_894671 [Fibularhizoctonia sp. CBS 109695]